MERALFALLSEDRQWLRGRLCEGEGAEDALHVFQFPMLKTEGPILAAMVREQDIIIDCARDSRYDGSRLVENSGLAHLRSCPSSWTTLLLAASTQT